jgi:sirohydrochlorin ferrochelatase
MTQPIHTTFIAHGYTKEEACTYLLQLVGGIAPNNPNVNLGFLVITKPLATEAILQHIEKGAKKIRIIPLFIAPGKHVSEDVPQVLSEIKKQHDVEFILEDFIGNHTAYKDMLKRLVE